MVSLRLLALTMSVHNPHVETYHSGEIESGGRGDNQGYCAIQPILMTAMNTKYVGAKFFYFFNH